MSKTSVLLQSFHGVCSHFVRTGSDFTFRQTTVLLTCYHGKGPQTVRGLAARMEINKPAITRACDTLQAAGLIDRKPDLQDRRSVLITLTPKGTQAIDALGVILMSKAA